MELQQIIAGTAPKAPNQNLINPVKISPDAKPQGFYKSIILDVFGVGFALLFGYTYYRYLTIGLTAWFVLGAFFLFSATSVLQAFLTKKLSRRALVLAGESVALIAFFPRYDDWRLLLAVALVIFVILLWGYMRSASELRNSIEIMFFRSTRDVLGKVVTASLFFMILVYAPQVNGQAAFIPRQSFTTFFEWSSGFLNNFYPGIPFTGSFGDLSQAFAKMELENNPTFGQMEPPAQNAAIEQAITQLSGDVAQTTGVAPTPTESTSDVMYDYIVGVLANWQNHLQDQFIIGWAVIVFLLLRTVGIFFVWAAQLLSLVFYEILLASGFMHAHEATQMKESVEY